MNKREFERRARLAATLASLGFTDQEAEQLRRISNTLQRWFERECNGEIQRGDDGIARGYRTSARFLDPNDPRYWYSVPDREAGARKRLVAVIAARNLRHGVVNENVPQKTAKSKAKRTGLLAYIQTDPRGAALYILRPGDVPAGEDVSGYYTRGVCVY